MNQKLTRRRFGQLVVASTTVVGLGYLANKTLAQSSLVIYGVRPGPIPPNNTGSKEEDIPEKSSTTIPTPTCISVGLILESLDPNSGKVQSLTVPQVLADGSPILCSDEELTDFTNLADGTLVLAITSVNQINNKAASTRLTVLNTSPTTVTVSGLKKQEKLRSLVGTNNGGLLGLVLKNNGSSPARLVQIDLKTGEITDSSNVEIPDDQRFDTLAQSPDGALYTIAVAKNGTSKLVKLDPGEKKPIILSPLSSKNAILNNGLQDLNYYQTGQLLAFGAPRYKTPNNLYSVDLDTGAASLIKEFNATKIVISRG